MDVDDEEKTSFVTPWETYCYRVISFGLKYIGETYIRAKTTIFHDMIHKEIEVYVDDVIIKSKNQADHVKDLRRFFKRLHRYDLKLNPAKCVFGVTSGNFLGFVVSHRGIELDPSKMSFLGRLNYISGFIAQLTTTCEPIFKLLKKSIVVEWTEECQEAFDKIKRYLSNSPILVPPNPDNFPDEEVLSIDEVTIDVDPGWKLFFDGAVNKKKVRIGTRLNNKVMKLKVRSSLKEQGEEMGLELKREAQMAKISSKIAFKRLFTGLGNRNMDYSGNCQTLVSSDDLFIDELLDLSNAFNDDYEGDDNPCSILSPKKPEKRR
ncbi:putative sodium transporter HKT1-like [Capsicum annuum]|nr:putative sodium transporter HKT1-like [Capsicum annuum]